MKKLITAILAIAFILSSFSSAFAAITISDIFVDEDGTHYFFGRFDYSKAEDAGLEVNGKDYNLNRSGFDYNDIPTALWDSAKRNGRFGIGLKDSNGIIGNGTAEVKPYEVIDGEKVYGESVIFNGADSKTPVGDEVITSITVGEDVIKGVSSSIFEYYYGLDELPDTAASLPSVTVATENEIKSEETVAELGGFTKKITVKYNEKEYVYNIYFRKNETVTLSNNRLLSSQGGWVRPNDLGYANINANEYGYAEFSTEALSGFDYVITGASLNANFKINLEEFEIGVSAYDSADMLIGDVGKFLNRDFKNFRTAGSVIPSDNNTYYDAELDYSKFRAEGDKIVLTFKKTGTATSYLYEPKLTITYVQKTPGLYDSTLKEIKIDDVAVENFDPYVTECYVGVENPEENHVITATPSYSESVVNISGNTITVKPVIGETRTYNIYFREKKSVTLTPTARFNSKVASKTDINLDTDNNVISTTDYSYVEFDVSSLGDIVVNSAELIANFIYNYAEITVGDSKFDGTFANADFLSFSEITAFTPTGTNTNKLNSNTVKLDYSKFTVRNGKILIVMKKKTAVGATYMQSPVLSLSYVEKTPGATDATLKEIKLDDVALEGFDPDVTEYYVGIEAGATTPVITATPSYSESAVTISGNTITVKPLIGESKVYTINFREIKTLTVTATEGAVISPNKTIQQKGSGPQAYGETDQGYTLSKAEHNMINYQEFDLSALTSNAIITDAEITADVFYVGAAPTNIYWHRSAFDTFEAVKPDGRHKEFTTLWTEARKPVLLGSFTISETIKVNTHMSFTSKLDASELNVVNNKVVLAATKGFGEENSTSMIYMTPKSSMTIKYIER